MLAPSGCDPCCEPCPAFLGNLDDYLVTFADISDKGYCSWPSGAPTVNGTFAVNPNTGGNACCGIYTFPGAPFNCNGVFVVSPTIWVGVDYDGTHYWLRIVFRVCTELFGMGGCVNHVFSKNLGSTEPTGDSLGVGAMTYNGSDAASDCAGDTGSAVDPTYDFSSATCSIVHA